MFDFFGGELSDRDWLGRLRCYKAGGVTFRHHLKVTRAEMLSDGPTPDEEAAAARQFECLNGLNEKGTVLLAGRTQNTDESSFGIVILEVDSEDAARAIQEADPDITIGIMRPELFPYRVALMPK